MGNVVVPKVASVFTKPVQENSGGALANLFRKLALKMGLANKIKALCRNAQIRDKAYRMKLNSKTFDDKLEHRLYAMATGDKLTFERFTALTSHLFDVVEFKFKVCVRVQGEDEWIEVEQNVFNRLGPIVDEEDEDDENGSVGATTAKQEYNSRRMRDLKGKVSKTTDQG